MVSVLGRLEERERAARKRVEELQAELETAPPFFARTEAASTITEAQSSAPFAPSSSSTALPMGRPL